jgi:hypothetical protein
MWTPRNVSLKVGTPYQVTFQSDPTRPTVRHGVGGLTALGVPADCSLLNPSCVWTITPTAAQAAFNGGVYQYGCVQTTCGSGHNSMAAGAVNGGTITITP